MPDIQQKNTPDRPNCSYLPQFCHADVFFRAVLVIELIAIVFALVAFEDDSLYLDIAMNSVFLQWIGLTSAAGLCACTRLGLVQTALKATLYAFVLVIGVTLIVSLGSIYLVDMMRIEPATHSVSLLLLRNIAVAVILTGVALHYFYLQFESKKTLEVQAQARLQALQARIRPHFLFNSMNTIASLTHDQPALAEKSIENLADLFRASLSADASVSLQQEVDLTHSYIELEAMRLGLRLTVNWHIADQVLEGSLPALTLQPLVENAIYHGIEPLAAGGVIDISIGTSNGFTDIIISNPVSPDLKNRHREGNQMAVENIRERLLIFFEGKATMQQLVENARFTVNLKIPATIS